MAATNLDAQGGFVAAANMMEGAPAVAGAALGELDVVDLLDGEVAHAVPQQGHMRWTNNTSGFILRRMTQIVSERSRTDKTYKDKDVNAIAKALSEYCGMPVTATEVYNHLRKWKQKWSKVARLKNLSGALFDEDVQAIMLEQDHYLVHCKVQNNV
jgi:predicted patatin/cPLA2 family phospholipase